MGAALAVSALGGALLTPGGAAGAGTFCTSIGLTDAAVRPILGRHVSANDYASPGQDAGDCNVYDVKGRNAHADIEIYTAGAASGQGIRADYAGGARTRNH